MTVTRPAVAEPAAARRPVPARVRVRRRVRVHGVVQGVGFRPFVHRLAAELGLDGSVGNDVAGVVAEVEGEPAAVAAFVRRVATDAPPLARVDRVEDEGLAVTGEPGFRIVASEAAGSHAGAGRTFVPPDVATCDDCLRELHDPGDRRYRYPFLNCTNCGPRFTITTRLPYDRPNTTMAGFALCPACAAEYHDPTDRRFHAQPVACPACGPRLWFEGPDGRVDGSDAALAAAQRALAAGAVVAVKGLGGYHLACDARSPAAVATLRRRKHRPHKPLAVMVPDLATARSLAAVDGAEAALLAGPQRPIVLLRALGDAGLAARVAPDNPLVGLLLPYTPLHHLLFGAVPASGGPSPPDALVMTSGNLSDEPICYEDADARDRLGDVADAWLVHDRPIHVPCDDSVVRVVDGDELPIRRSRGYAPLPVRLPFAARPGLAVGGELKAAFCLASGHDAWLSQHIGDMGSVEALGAFARSARQFAAMYGVEAHPAAADAHPGYHSRRWADERADGSVALVQHHHAHVAALMAEHGLASGERVIGCAFDGTGYGTDGAIWGGEVLVAGYEGFDRACHLAYVPLPGGDAAVRKPYRAALAHLWAAGIEWAADLPPVRAASPAERTMLRRQLDRGVGCVPTSSMGRLFDAVSALVGVRQVVTYEAQAAVELEALAVTRLRGARRYRFGLAGGEADAAPVLAAIVDDLRAGRPVGAVAAGFHLAVAHLIADAAARLRQETGLDRVGLTGGVFQNALLVRLTRALLAERGLRALTHRVVPPNDGGLALGQVAVAAHAPPAPGTALDRSPEADR